MPYEIRRQGAEFCVYKQGTSERLGCHPSEQKARKQMAALYANESGKATAEAFATGLKAALTSTADLPDSAFAYIEPGCDKKDGKTLDRCRHFPIHDAAHVRNALARLGQSPFGDKARAKVEAAAKRMSIGAPAGKAVELKAEPMTTTQLDRWLAGKVSRRILVLPFGGPFPSAKSALGVDLDGEWFDEDTNRYGNFPSLRGTRERLVDWHHTTFMPDSRKDPVGDRMKGAILGHVVLDEDPEEDGVWADFWANAGERRRKLVAMLEKRDVPLYGSSQPVQRGVVKADTGHIEVWPIYRHTITTAPQNTYAVVPALKAALGSPSLDEIPADALKALLTGLEPEALELLTSSLDTAVQAPDPAGDSVVKSGRVLAASKEQRLREAIAMAIEQVISELDDIVGRAAAQQENASP